MKMLFKSLSIGLVLAVIFTLVPFKAECENISNELFRLHILANSDSEEDQELKLMVRNKVLEYTKTLYKNSNSKGDTISITAENLNNILSVAQDEVYSRGYNYTVSGEITKMYFNTRTYGNSTIPSGMYDALRIKIGKAEGHNCWCVMYPSFCVGESISLKDTNLSESEKELIKDESNFKVKFKIVEWFEKIKSFF